MRAPDTVTLGAPDAAPLLLAEAHARLPVGATITVAPAVAAWPPGLVRDVVVGAGFLPRPRRRAVRARTLPDTVAPGMTVLVCGLNPSVYAADAGVGYARPGNRFWPAALAAGLVSRDRDARHALVHHGVGFTDLVKRATASADELHPEELRAGFARVERLCAWLRPGAVCFVGLAGWRAAVDRGAVAGWQGRGVGGVPAYVMPSTSGRVTSTRVERYVEHLRAVTRVP